MNTSKDVIVLGGIFKNIFKDNKPKVFKIIFKVYKPGIFKNILK